MQSLTQNRKPENIFLLSSRPFSIVAAMDHGFCSVPVIRYQQSPIDDFQLKLIENYIIKLKYSKDNKLRNITDFGFLKQSIAVRQVEEVKMDSNVSNP